MKIKKTIFTAAILMAAVCLPAQNKSAGINISIWKDICTQPHDSTQTTYVNIGLLSTMNRLNLDLLKTAVSVSDTGKRTKSSARQRFFSFPRCGGRCLNMHRPK